MLKIDVDVPFRKWLKAFLASYKIMCIVSPRLRIVYAEVYHSRHGYHVYLMLNRALGEAETYCLQACFGSDLKRETFNIVRHLEKYSSKIQNVMFKPERRARKLEAELKKFLEKFNREFSGEETRCLVWRGR